MYEKKKARVNLTKAAAITMASLICLTVAPAAAPKNVLGSMAGTVTAEAADTISVAVDGTYRATLRTYKYKHGRRDDTYTGTLRVTVRGGKIYALSYSGDKSDKIRSSIRSAGASYIGKAASVSVISEVDAVSSASLRTDGSATRTTSKKYYVMDLKGAIVSALRTARTVSGGSSSSGSTGGSTGGNTGITAVADGTYKGSSSNSSSSESNKITVTVTVSGGKITALDKVDSESVGSWDSLLATVKNEVVGSTAAASNVDAVSSATTKGWKAAIQTAIKNALNGQKTSEGGSSSGSSSSGSSSSGTTTEKAVSDGTYKATLRTYKYKHGRRDDTYTGTLRVTVRGGKIYALSYSGDKSDKIRSSIRSAGASYIGKTASASVINGVDAVSSASLRTDGSAGGSSSKKYYVMDLKGAIVKALQNGQY